MVVATDDEKETSCPSPKAWPSRLGVTQHQGWVCCYHGLWWHSTRAAAFFVCGDDFHGCPDLCVILCRGGVVLSAVAV